MAAAHGRRLDSIQAARAVAACGVVACHMLGYETKYLSGTPVASPAWQYGMVGVDLYFVISGFVITTMCMGRFGQPGEARRFLVQRAVRIYPAYWVWCLAVLAVFMLQPDMVNSRHGRPDVVRSLLLLPQRNLPLLLVSWTLVYEMFFYLLFAAALCWLREDDLVRVPIAWAVVVIAGHALLRPGETQPVLNLLFSPLLVEFILGCLVAQHGAEMGRRAAIGSLIMGVTGFAAGTLALAARGEPFPPGWTRVLIYGSSSALVVAGLIALERSGRQRVPRPLVALGDASYSLYLSHVPVIAVVGLVWRRLAAEPPAGLHVAALATGFVVALAAGVASFHLIEVPLLRASRRLVHVATAASIR